MDAIRSAMLDHLAEAHQLTLRPTVAAVADLDQIHRDDHEGDPAHISVNSHTHDPYAVLIYTADADPNGWGTPEVDRVVGPFPDLRAARDYGAASGREFDTYALRPPVRTTRDKEARR